MQSRKIAATILSLLIVTALVWAGYSTNLPVFAPAKKQIKTALKTVLFKVNKIAYADQNLDRNPGELDSLGLLYGTDKTTDHHYTEIYEDVLSPLKNKADKILEIGIAGGASIRMWRDYFAKATIYGIDINDKSEMNSNTIKTYIADQADRSKLQKFIGTYGGDYDFIIDDGGHSMEQQQISFGFLFKQVKPGGYYIIEDVHTSIYALYGNEYGATVSGEKTTLAMIDNFIRTGIIKSAYMTPEEEYDLTSNLESCNLFSRDNGKSIACIFRKKAKSQA